MPLRRSLIACIAAAGLACSTASALAERIAFATAARDSQVVDIFQGRTAYSERIYGELRLPTKGSGPFPAMVIMHSSRGIVASIDDWAAMLNAMGIASFVVDSFAPRDISEASAGQLGFAAGVVDALGALSVLRSDARIDGEKIGVMGFSRGAVAAMNSSFERYRVAVLGSDGGRFAAHIVFYGGCAQYARTTGSPILSFIGSDDDFSNAGLCLRQSEVLRQHGATIELVVYDGAVHGFDTDFAQQYMPRVTNFRNCLVLQDLDSFAATLIDDRALSAAERADYAKRCVGLGAVRGGDRKYAALARQRVKLFLAKHLGLAP